MVERLFLRKELFCIPVFCNELAALLKLLRQLLQARPYVMQYSLSQKPNSYQKRKKGN